jgi:uncharacterized protein (TIGR02444 family)
VPAIESWHPFAAMTEPAAKLCDEEALWRFSLVFYACPGVSEALIVLQDRAGCDVNLMLFALWVGVAGGTRLTKEQLARADQIARPIRTNIVEPLRALRRKLKAERDSDVQSLRMGIEAIELEAEKVIQVRLCRSARSAGSSADPAARAAAAHANLALYLSPGMTRSPEAAAIREALDAFVGE